jgi:hypothetical protein
MEGREIKNKMESDVKIHEEEPSSPSHTLISRSQRFAHIISELFNPLFVALPTFFVIALASAPNFGYALLWWAIASSGVSIAPFLFVMQGVRRGKLTDRHVSKREQRFLPLVFGISCVVIAFILLLLLRVSSVLLATITAVIVALLLSTIITRFWKISLHLVGIAGAVTVFVLLFGPLLLLLTPLVVLVAWARWRVDAHTPAQALAGTLLAIVVTVALFWAFRVL